MTKVPFEEVEVEYLRTEWFEKFDTFDRKKRVQIKGRDGTVTAMTAFLLKVRKAFGNQFPYRHPKTDPNTLSEEQRKLQYSRAFWYDEGKQGVLEKFRHRFGYMKRCLNKSESPQKPRHKKSSTGSGGVRSKSGASRQTGSSEEEEEEEEDEVYEEDDEDEDDEDDEENEEEEESEGRDLDSEGNAQGTQDEEGGDGDGEAREAGGMEFAADLTEEDEAVSLPESLYKKPQSTRIDADGDEDMEPAPGLEEGAQGEQESSSTAVRPRPRKGRGRRNTNPRRRKGQNKSGLTSEQRNPTVARGEQVNRSYAGWAQTLEELSDMMGSSWSACGPEELARRHRGLPENVRNLLQLLSFATGTEIYATGVNATRRAHRAFHTSTPRSAGFLGTLEESEIQSQFVGFVHERIGTALCVSSQCPGPCVCPDPEQDERPLLPPNAPTHAQNQRHLGVYFSYLLSWQTGGTEVPYELIMSEQSQGRWTIIREEVLPPGIAGFKCPNDMDQDEVVLWQEHIWAGERRDIPDNRIFQYLQPRPGVFHPEYVTQRPMDAQPMEYAPESHAYSRFLAGFSAPKPLAREDGLPTFDAESSPFMSFDDRQREQMKRLVNNDDDPSIKLLDLLCAYDVLRPHQFPAEEWSQRAKDMPHIKAKMPYDCSAFDHLTSYPHLWLTPQFFNYLDHDHYCHGLTHTLAWCNSRYWLHEPSGTISGGPYGIKWAIMLLILIRYNYKHLANISANEATPIPDGIRVEWTERDEDQFRAAVNDIATALNSCSILVETYADREIKNADPHAFLSSAHEEFEASIPKMRLLEPLEHDDPWHDVNPRTQAEHEALESAMEVDNGEHGSADSEGAILDTTQQLEKERTTRSKNMRKRVASGEKVVKTPRKARKVAFKESDDVQPSTGVRTRSKAQSAPAGLSKSKSGSYSNPPKRGSRM